MGGFDAPDPIPWYVMLKMLTENGTKEGSICGGALINSRFGKKMESDKNEKPLFYNVCYAEKRTKHNSVLLLRLVRFSAYTDVTTTQIQNLLTPFK